MRQALEKKGLEYEKVNVPTNRDDELRQELAEKSGVWTVPVLKVVNQDSEEYIGESDKIISWILLYNK